MPQIRRKAPPRHLLIPDTNVLWRRDKEEVVVSPEIVEFWDGYAGKFNIDLLVPEVVRGELLYQYTTSCQQALERANKQFDRMSRVADSKYRHRVTVKRLTRDVTAKIDRFFGGLGAEIVQTPYTSIDWSTLADNAIWRRPPFTEERDREKGFRDSLILETVCNIASKRRSPSVAFISDDKLLRRACESRLATSNHVTCYQSIDEFASTLRLLDEELTQEFVSAIRKRAIGKFYQKDDDACLYIREDIHGQIKNDFQEKFSAPIARPNSRTLGALQTIVRWAGVSGEKIYIRHPTFLKLEGEREYYWQSEVSFVELFRLEGGSSGSLLGFSREGQVNIRKLIFTVDWKALVDQSGRFRKVNLIEIKPEEDQLDELTQSEADLYGFPMDEQGDT